MKRSWQSFLLNGLLRLGVRSRYRADDDPVQSRQQAIEAGRRFNPPLPPGIESRSRAMGNVPALFFENSNGEIEKSVGDKKAILYLHGGGFYVPALSLHERFVGILSNALQCQVFMPDYRLVPEHVFPAAVDDCLQSYQFLLDEGYVAENIIIAGDSAGGNLALVTLMSARDLGLPMPAGAVLLSPATDCLFRGPSLKTNRHRDPLFKVSTLHWMLGMYLPAKNYRDPKASPLCGSFEGLPPLRFHVGSTELLLDSSRLADRKARRQGVDSSVRVWHKMPHVFPLLPYLPEAQQATNQIVEFMQTCWSSRRAK
ncbi:MAG: alpha/beta hydrolase [Pseudomonadales bacterium]